MRTHCKRGHALTEANVYMNRTTGRRACKQCALDRQRAAYEQDYRALSPHERRVIGSRT